MQDLTTFISSHPLLCLATALVFVLTTIVELLRSRKNTNNLSPSRAIMLINHENAAIIDTRANDQYKKGHIIDAISMSGKDLRDNSKRLEKFRTRPIIITCNTGIDSQKIAALLSKQGYNVYTLTGGMRAWIEAQMPVVKD